MEEKRRALGAMFPCLRHHRVLHGQNVVQTVTWPHWQMGNLHLHPHHERKSTEENKTHKQGMHIYIYIYMSVLLGEKKSVFSSEGINKLQCVHISASLISTDKNCPSN